MFCNNPLIYGLLHGTEISNLKNILSSDSLLTTYDLQKHSVKYKGYTAGDWEIGGQFVGAYFGLIGPGSKISHIYYNPDFPTINLVFSPAVLDERDDYHVNSADQQGFILNNTYNKEQFSKLSSDDLKKVIYSKAQNEVVFHNRVSLDYLDYIIVFNKNLFQNVKPLIDEYNKKHFTNIPVYLNRNFFKSKRRCYKPRLCSYIPPMYINEYGHIIYDHHNQINDKEVKKMAIEGCGIHPDEIKNLSRNEIFELIHKKEIEMIDKEFYDKVYSK